MLLRDSSSAAKCASVAASRARIAALRCAGVVPFAAVDAASDSPPPSAAAEAEGVPRPRSVIIVGDPLLLVGASERCAKRSSPSISISSSTVGTSTDDELRPMAMRARSRAKRCSWPSCAEEAGRRAIAISCSGSGGGAAAPPPFPCCSAAPRSDICCHRPIIFSAAREPPREIFRSAPTPPPPADFCSAGPRWGAIGW